MEHGYSPLRRGLAPDFPATRREKITEFLERSGEVLDVYDEEAIQRYRVAEHLREVDATAEALKDLTDK